ncbi:MAG TPA: STAS domain-containing protein [Cellvibrio sp.]|nr:STAS domain-containing protein [Cellvibrio sp.]
MHGSDTITIPRRFDYTVSNSFNTVFVALLETLANTNQTIKLDCAKMEYIDSAGIGLLVMSYKKAQKFGIKIMMINVADSVKDILVMANLQKLIEIH